ncbi:hypothetical protein GWK08_01075 [Leptobacterium flavescens]|uniref:DUF985 domain-containing protein n=1 Tax=Leptobacterium flavescens TaxID=472055 RepID=A0A6P0UHU6_9FLAO|nr:cupin domain-containing protein [Leptobacterium flavescens]NER12020.1 hypothetical protein [Leptobacterium flavescens]
MHPEVKKLVESLELLPHPEGGFYKEVYRSNDSISRVALPNKFNGKRSYATSIYFLITSGNFSAFHRIKQDEIWHFYGGSPLYVHCIDENGNYIRNEVGMDIENGQAPQLVVPAGVWFGSSVKDDNSYSLVGCTVAPGFDFDDFELAEREALSTEFPQHSNIISDLTRI